MPMITSLCTFPLADKISKLRLHAHRGIRRGKIETVAKVAALSSKV